VVPVGPAEGTGVGIIEGLKEGKRVVGDWEGLDVGKLV